MFRHQIQGNTKAGSRKLLNVMNLQFSQSSGLNIMLSPMFKTVISHTIWLAVKYVIVIYTVLKYIPGFFRQQPYPLFILERKYMENENELDKYG